MIHEVISKRYSTRAFSGNKIEEDKLRDLFEAARWSPSSRNEQPWRFIYAVKDDTEAYKAFLNILSERNRLWAENAPLLILTIAKVDSDVNKLINRHAFYDLGGAVATLTVQAMSMDLCVHQIGGFNALLAREYFEIPDNFEPVSILAIGYKGSPDKLPADLKSREEAPRKRKDLREIVFCDKFGKTGKLFLPRPELNNHLS